MKKRDTSYDCMIECNRRGIFIYPVPILGTEKKPRPQCHIEIVSQGKVRRTELIFSQNKEMYATIMEYYGYYCRTKEK